MRLQQSLPVVPVPLSSGDPAASLDLQAIFITVYDRLGLDESVDYRNPPVPPLEDDGAEWVKEVVGTVA